VFANYLDTHDPYLPPEPYRHTFSSAKNPGGLLQSGAEAYPTLTSEQLQGEIDAYDGAIAYTDVHIGLLLDALQQRGLLANTFVIVTSDHGEAFGEHGLFLHQNALYRELIRVPLIIARPGHVPAGVRVAAPVSNAALPVTVMDLIGAGNPVPFPQSSLAQLWNDHAVPADWPHPLAELAHFSFGPRQRPSHRGAMKTLVSMPWQYIVHEKLGAELYDWSIDPGEAQNLVTESRVQHVVDQLAAELPPTSPHR
jgi:arylsulfatase A-like enzyme